MTSPYALRISARCPNRACADEVVLDPGLASSGVPEETELYCGACLARLKVSRGSLVLHERPEYGSYVALGTDLQIIAVGHSKSDAKDLAIMKGHHSATVVSCSRRRPEDT